MKKEELVGRKMFDYDCNGRCAEAASFQAYS